MGADVAGISPAPTDEEAAAIVAAVELLWPKPTTATDADGAPSGWRFSGRRWTHTTTWPRRNY